MFRLKKECVCEHAYDGRGPVAFHFYFPGEGNGDALLTRAVNEVADGRVFTLNAYANIELLGRFGIRETPALLVMDAGHELLRIEGLAPERQSVTRRLSLAMCS
jgi:hypothetical protein